MHPASDATNPATANDILKQRSEAWLPRGITIAVLFHVAVFTLSPDMSTAVEAGTSSDTQLIAPAELKLPDAPPPIESPAEPIVGSIELDASITISPTTPDAWSPEKLAPPVRAERGEREHFDRFVASMIAPELLNADEVERELRRMYPPMLRDAGIAGDVVVNLWLDEDGLIVDAEVARSSGYELFDRAALKVVEKMRLTPAQNRGAPVRVIVAIPVRFRVQ